MSFKTVPGQKGQPEKDFVGMSFESMQWLHTTSPVSDYKDREGNPLQETAPTQVKVWNGDSNTMTTKTSNDINGGRGM